MGAIPFNKPSFVGKELHYIAQAIHSGHAAGDGAFTARCHALLQDALGVPKVLLTSSCTDALEMAALLLDIEPGDEIIVPSFTFVSTANAFVLRGATPVFADCRADTLNLDETQLERLIGPRTKAIVPMHYGGVSCEMDAIRLIARRHRLAIVEDGAHGPFARYKGRPIGTFGRFATLSFHETKNFMCGEGGALLINDPADVERAEILREKGTNRSRFFRGQVDKYTWVDLGSSFLPSEIVAAFLLAQLEARELIQTRRRRLWERYRESLAGWALRHDVQLPTVPPHCDQSYHLFYLVMPTPEARDRFIEHLKANGIWAVFHYLPLHLSPMGRRFGGEPGACPVAERVADRLVRLPFYNDMSSAEQAQVVAAVRTARLESVACAANGDLRIGIGSASA